MKTFWVSWYGGDRGDPRPVTFPVPIEWWCTGEDASGVCSICAIVIAESEPAAQAQVLAYWPEAKWRFCSEKEPGWRPNPERFPPKATPSRAAS